MEISSEAVSPYAHPQVVLLGGLNTHRSEKASAGTVQTSAVIRQRRTILHSNLTEGDRTCMLMNR